MIPSKETLDALMALGPNDPATPINGCHCDFCTRKKRFEDNWCPGCALVKMDPPKWWENMDVCDACEKQMDAERCDRPDGHVGSWACLCGDLHPGITP